MTTRPAFTNKTNIPVRLTYWVQTCPGLNENTQITILPGQSTPIPKSVVDEYIVLYENYTRLGKFRLSGWYQDCFTHDGKGVWALVKE